ncbi:MAG: hypothetical protein N3F09_08750 [Bacteroidia bacterium]|nr:hypothetical protein [Bacteroidia bacterium]
MILKKITIIILFNLLFSLITYANNDSTKTKKKHFHASFYLGYGYGLISENGLISKYFFKRRLNSILQYGGEIPIGFKFRYRKLLMASQVVHESFNGNFNSIRSYQFFMGGSFRLKKSLRLESLIGMTFDTFFGMFEGKIYYFFNYNGIRHQYYNSIFYSIRNGVSYNSKNIKYLSFSFYHQYMFPTIGFYKFYYIVHKNTINVTIGLNL